MVFDREWFEKHQKLLLWGANTWIGRKILCIDGDKSSVGNKKIVKIDPDSITWLVKKNNRRVTLSAEFRTHAKFSKRLYYAFYPIWYVIHAWDTLFANPFIPDFNLGFDTLTVYPDPDAESTSVDGDVGRDVAEEAWGTIKAGAGNYSADAGATIWAMRMSAGNTSNLWQRLFRGIFLFDTSALTASATISATVFSLYGNDILDESPTVEPILNVYASTPASNTALANSDYGNLGTTAFADTGINFASLSTSAYNDLTFNATGLAAVSKTSITKLGTRDSVYDVGSTTPPWVGTGQTWFRAKSADTAGTTTDPKLVVTYTLPAVAALSAFRSLLGVGL